MREDLIGTVVEERYLIEAMLGAGAMGRVYRARHTRIGREVAIKVLRDDLVREPAIVERFEREARVAARLRHPNLVSVLDVGEHLMVMELAAGRPLADLTGAPLPRARIVALVAQLLRGLSHAHAAGLVHRDLKPENILVERHADGTETARIVDFGIAVLRDGDGGSREGRRLTEAGLVVGTPLYMSPEQATGKAIDHRTDLFSLGVIVYELLAGAAPFEGTGAEVAYANVTKEPPPIASRVRGVDVDPLLEAFARKLMARRLDDRFATAHEALEVLELIDRDRDAAARRLGLFAGPAEAPPAVLRLPHDSDALTTLPLVETQTTEAIRRSSRGPWVAAACAAAVLALVGWVLIHREPAAARVSEAPVASTSPAPLASTSPTPVASTSPAPVASTSPTPQPSLVASTGVSALAPTADPIVTPVVAPPPDVTGQPAVVSKPIVAPSPAVRRTPAAAIATVPEKAVEQPAIDDSAAAVAARYHAVGNALHARGTDELWQQYRRIQLGDAMATAASRHAALATLDAIEHALPAS